MGIHPEWSWCFPPAVSPSTQARMCTNTMILVNSRHKSFSKNMVDKQIWQINWIFIGTCTIYWYWENVANWKIWWIKQWQINKNVPFRILSLFNSFLCYFFVSSMYHVNTATAMRACSVLNCVYVSALQDTDGQAPLHYGKWEQDVLNQYTVHIPFVMGCVMGDCLWHLTVLLLPWRC